MSSSPLAPPFGTTSLFDLLEKLEADPETPGRYHVTVDGGWMQGRTVYGGLVAGLALAAARRTLIPAFSPAGAPPDPACLPPLRAAEVAFIGPAGHALELQVSILRRGRRVTFAGVDVFSEGALATRLLFTFAAGRDSGLTMPPARPLPGHLKPLESGVQLARSDGPAFLAHFDAWLVAGDLPGGGGSDTDIHVWTRINDPRLDEVPPAVAFLTLGDVLPPAILSRLDGFAPLSSLTWSINLRHVPDRGALGWVLLNSRADWAAHGYSGQTMAAWDGDGVLMATAHQTVAVFA
ncbi:acyl-CoA thioesterase [Yunchengibacter salinarum]|uniref:acyl-CoA thioesterase n=1 Tax=Yunchengibacter salinarum TaxID=3133399 RepID=UPI0035B69FDA